MINLHMNNNNQTEIDMICSPAEDIKLSKKVDLIFTSPPYFNTEKYDYDNPKQSHNRYKTVDEWLEKFLFQCLSKFSENLIDEGHIVLNIADRLDGEENLIPKIITFMNGLPVKFIGTIGLQCISKNFYKHENNGVYCEPILVWKK